MKKYYMAYGSNMNKELMSLRSNTAKVIGTGFLEGYALVFRTYANIEPDKTAKVPVMIWEIDRACERALDRYESYPVLYRKEYLDIELDGKVYNAMVYVMNEKHSGYKLPDKNYISIILEGYIDEQIDRIYVKEAWNRTLNYINNK